MLDTCKLNVLFKESGERVRNARESTLQSGISIILSSKKDVVFSLKTV